MRSSTSPRLTPRGGAPARAPGGPTSTAASQDEHRFVLAGLERPAQEEEGVHGAPGPRRLGQELPDVHVHRGPGADLPAIGLLRGLENRAGPPPAPRIPQRRPATAPALGRRRNSPPPRTAARANAPCAGCTSGRRTRRPLGTAHQQLVQICLVPAVTAGDSPAC